MPLVNILVDYVSLWETRGVLRWIAGRLPLWVGVILDALLTGLIFFAVSPLGPMLGIWLAGVMTVEAAERAVAILKDLVRSEIRPRAARGSFFRMAVHDRQNP